MSTKSDSPNPFTVVVTLSMLSNRLKEVLASNQEKLCYSPEEVFEIVDDIARELCLDAADKVINEEAFAALHSYLTFRSPN